MDLAKVVQELRSDLGEINRKLDALGGGFLDAKGAAGFLSISERHLESLVAAGKIPALDVGGKRVFDVEALRAIPTPRSIRRRIPRKKKPNTLTHAAPR